MFIPIFCSPRVDRSSRSFCPFIIQPGGQVELHRGSRPHCQRTSHRVPGQLGYWAEHQPLCSSFHYTGETRVNAHPTSFFQLGSMCVSNTSLNILFFVFFAFLPGLAQCATVITALLSGSRPWAVPRIQLYCHRVHKDGLRHQSAQRRTDTTSR